MVDIRPDSVKNDLLAPDAIFSPQEGLSMKGIILSGAMSLVFAGPVFAESEKIDPETYICAELVASQVDGEAPLFQGLQLDGYSAAKNGINAADPASMSDLLLVVSDSCEAKPGDTVLRHWQEARKEIPANQDTRWQADKFTCADYNADPDEGSGFVIWLDGYWRGKTGKKASIFSSQETLDHFLDVCKANPQKLMLDVLAENAK